MMKTRNDRASEKPVANDSPALASGGSKLAPPHFQLKASAFKGAEVSPDKDAYAMGAPVQMKKNSRFDSNADLEAAFKNKDVLEIGDKGLGVTILQQGLVDAGYDLKSGVTGDFDAETEAAVKQFQTDRGLKVDGKAGKKTLTQLSKLHNTLAPEKSMAETQDPLTTKIDARKLRTDEKDAANESIKIAPTTATGVAKTFVDKVGGKTFEKRLRERADDVIAEFYGRFLDMEKKRKDPKNLHDWADIEKLAGFSKAQVDGVYGSYYDASSKAPMTKGKNLHDKWDWEEKLLKDPAYNTLAVANLAADILYKYTDDIVDMHGADFDRAAEKVVFDTILADLIATKSKELAGAVQEWPATTGKDGVKLQIFKESTNSKNRDFMWYNFSVLMHEYLHTLQHPDYKTYRAGKGPKDGNIALNEGVTDYLTEVIWKNLSFDDKMRADVEGPYHNPKVKHNIDKARSTYSTMANAERLAGIVGLKNLLAAYFQGQIQYVGAK